MSSSSSTIVAISTSPGIGGIGIIRMSGKDCFKILDKVFKQKNHKDIDDIKGSIALFKKLNQIDNICVIGNGEAINKCKDQLDEIFDFNS